MRFEKFLITFLGFLLGVLITLVLTSINIEQMKDEQEILQQENVQLKIEAEQSKEAQHQAEQDFLQSESLLIEQMKINKEILTSYQAK